MLSLDGDEHGATGSPSRVPFRLQAVRERFTAIVRERSMASSRIDGDGTPTCGGPRRPAVGRSDGARARARGGPTPAPRWAGRRDRRRGHEITGGAPDRRRGGIRLSVRPSRPALDRDPAPPSSPRRQVTPSADARSRWPPMPPSSCSGASRRPRGMTRTRSCTCSPTEPEPGLVGAEPALARRRRSRSPSGSSPRRRSSTGT